MKETIRHMHLLWIFVILSLLVGATLGFVIGSTSKDKTPQMMVVDEEGNVIPQENGLPFVGQSAYGRVIGIGPEGLCIVYD